MGQRDRRSRRRGTRRGRRCADDCTGRRAERAFLGAVAVLTLVLVWWAHHGDRVWRWVYTTHRAGTVLDAAHWAAHWAELKRRARKDPVCAPFLRHFDWAEQPRCMGDLHWTAHACKTFARRARLFPFPNRSGALRPIRESERKRWISRGADRQRQILELAAFTSTILAGMGVRHWASNGFVLGMIRDGAPPFGDDDADFGIFEEDMAFVRDSNFSQIVALAGHRCIWDQQCVGDRPDLRLFKIIYEGQRYREFSCGGPSCAGENAPAHVDIFVWGPVGASHLRQRGSGKHCPFVAARQGLQRTTAINAPDCAFRVRSGSPPLSEVAIPFPCPKGGTEAYLKRQYGADWRTPQRTEGIVRSWSLRSRWRLQKRKGNGSCPIWM